MRKCSRYQARYEMQRVASYNLDVLGGLVKRGKTRGSTRRVTKKTAAFQNAENTRHSLEREKQLTCF